MNDLPLGNIDWDDPVAIGGVGGRRGLDRRSARNSEAEAAEGHSPKLHRPIRATELGLIRTRLKRQPTLVVIRVFITVAGCQQPYRDIRSGDAGPFHNSGYRLSFPGAQGRCRSTAAAPFRAASFPAREGCPIEAGLLPQFPTPESILHSLLQGPGQRKACPGSSFAREPSHPREVQWRGCAARLAGAVWGTPMRAGAKQRERDGSVPVTMDTEGAKATVLEGGPGPV